MKLIPLTNSDLCAKVADEWYELLTNGGQQWFLSRWGYASRCVGRDEHGKRVYENMESRVCRAPYGMTIDHINHDPLDNQPENLRPATFQQNNFNRVMLKNNTSGMIGVYWSRVVQAYMAQVKVKGIGRIYLGQWRTLEEAGYAHDIGVELLHGEFAVFNNPLGLTDATKRRVRDKVVRLITSYLANHGVDHPLLQQKVNSILNLDVLDAPSASNVIEASLPSRNGQLHSDNAESLNSQFRHRAEKIDKLLEP